MAAVRHLGFLKFNFLTIGAVKRPILHKVINFIKIGQTLLKPLRRYRDFCDFQDVGYCHVGFSKIRNFNGRYAVRGPRASSCQISSKSVKRLQRYGDLTVFFQNGRRLNHLYHIFWWSVKGCGFCGGSKIVISHWQSQSLLTQGWRYSAARDYRTGVAYRRSALWRHRLP